MMQRERERERGLSTDYGTQSGLECVGVRCFKCIVGTQVCLL